MRIALGVTGGVAAYKAAELVRRLQEENFDVEVVMTRGAAEFIRPLTFAALTGHKVIGSIFGAGEGEPANVESAIEHIAVARRIDLLLVAPATADILAKMAAGIADDFLTTLYLAAKVSVVVAPAMNVNMWEHPATRENVARLRARGVRVVDPDEGYLACGMTGAGRLAGFEAILKAVHESGNVRRDLAGETVLVTAGPTCEDIDPVRYITNRSSGRMGYAVAQAAAARGAKVILVSGPTALAAPEGVERVEVRSADQMSRVVDERLEESTVVIMAAAVADHRPALQHPQKIKRGSAPMTLNLEMTPDILAEVCRRKRDRIVVSFAAETERLAEHARRKLAAKPVDLIVANDVLRRDAGFDVDTNIVTFFTRDGREQALPKLSKREVAERILDEVVQIKIHTDLPGAHGKANAGQA
ncbi:MAG TPA: bifunctional phosphopantothenoylcysteine decarboxylase/phosphopantothenate--cysteine ligase CoaBC [Candidatus Dormibacteraeota bacterium]|nr:bifunctional phosphopantothenoylcysteine decarboxylase/phosphopantothenate--cysteine ligase CoaBC [Candidatus Dormibacteraeota bacterium]